MRVCVRVRVNLDHSDIRVGVPERSTKEAKQPRSDNSQISPVQVLMFNFTDNEGTDSVRGLIDLTGDMSGSHSQFFSNTAPSGR